jgi:hypothetical protein
LKRVFIMQEVTRVELIEHNSLNYSITELFIDPMVPIDRKNHIKKRNIQKKI